MCKKQQEMITGLQDSGCKAEVIQVPITIGFGAKQTRPGSPNFIRPISILNQNAIFPKSSALEPETIGSA